MVPGGGGLSHVAAGLDDGHLSGRRTDGRGSRRVSECGDLHIRPVDHGGEVFLLQGLGFHLAGCDELGAAVGEIAQFADVPFGCEVVVRGSLL
ncbi:hypothetical protein [Streptomyces sp. NPDC093591]|uniref:hypothetical protein n=1 Tax=Streptomyces sp. NPDC093591 TaxID=3366044 RepID=UPI003824977E